MPSYLASVLLLALVVGAGVVAIVTIRGRWLASDAGRGDWEKTLADCKNLRDDGGLSEEEYRRVRTLVEPLTRIGTPDPHVRHRPAGGSSGQDHERT